MTTFAGERGPIESRFVSGLSSTPVTFENVPDPAAVTTAKGAGNAWVRLTIRDTLSRTAGIAGDNDILEEHRGLIIAQVFTRENTGTAAGRTLATSIATLYRHARFSGIKCQTPRCRPVGNDGFGWYQINVEVPYRRFSNT